MKKCIVSKEYFKGKESGYYRTYHSNIKQAIAEFYESPNINVIIGEIYVTDEDNSEEIVVGEYGIIYFKTKYMDNQNIFDINDIEEKTEFKTTLSDENSTNYDVVCYLWKPVNENIIIFCKLNKLILSEKIKLNSANLIYNGRKIEIISQMNYTLKIKQLNTTIPFIYSNNQTIEIEKGKDLYEVKLRALEYNNEQLMLLNLPKEEEELNNMFLDSCNLKGKYLICHIYRKKIEQLLAYSGQEYKLNYLDNNSGQLIEFAHVFNIKINYNFIQKENIYINISRLFENKISVNNYISFGTNITSIDNIITNKFLFDSSYYSQIYCLFKKDEEKSLLMICKCASRYTIDINKIKKEIQLNNISIQYNLLIQPRDKKDTIDVKGWSGNILFATPMILDFTKSDELIINYYINNNDYYDSVRLNPDSNEDLTCINLGNIKKCNVTREHFNDNLSGYYYTYHKNDFENYAISYELSPIKIILPTYIVKIIVNEEPIKLGKKGAISLITDFIDSKNIFNSSDIETKIFNAQFSGINSNYSANCHFWVLIGENLRLICQFNENIYDRKIKLNNFTFNYDRHKLLVSSDIYLNIRQLNSIISFLYSDKQIINITNMTDEYNLVFKKEIYNKEPLILYNEDNNMEKMYLNCIEESKMIKCSIQKDRLVGILTKSGGKFYLSHLTEEEGILKLNYVFDIIIYYENVEKKNISINKIKLLTHKVDVNNFIAFETDIDNISLVTTDYFIINQNRNRDMKCLFKKSNEQKDDKLLLLCKADLPGEYKLDMNKINLDYINILYSFEIPETHIKDTINVTENEGTKILSVYPNSLNFTSQDILTIKYQAESPEKIKNIKLNSNPSSYLECQNEKGIKECIVPQSHFNKSGYYYTYYITGLETETILYEIPKIQITLKSDDGGKGTDEDKGGEEDKSRKEDKGQSTQSNTKLIGIILGSVAGGIALIGVIVIIVIFSKKKKRNTVEIIEKCGNILPKPEEVELVGGNK